jgi:hypothetical protein
MKVRTLLTIHSLTAAVVCVNFFGVPGFWISLYGAQANPQALLLFRFIAALLGGVAVMSWVARSSGPSPSRDAMLWGLLVMNGLSTLVSVLGAWSGVYNQLAWGAVGMFALLTMGFVVIAPARRPVSPRRV